MFSSGEIVDAKYRVVSELGSGSFATVYKAQHVDTGLTVALKCFSASPENLDQYNNSLAAAEATSHINIVELLDSGSADTPYLVYEFVDGCTLEAFLKRPATTQTQLISVLSQVLAALCCLHNNNIVHSDIKPSNIMVDSSGSKPFAKVLDLGLSRIVGSTKNREITGTPAYCSPEQLRGDAVDPTSDLYSWALLLVECVTGQPAIARTDAEEIVAWQLEDTPCLLPDSISNLPASRYLQQSLVKEQSSRCYEPEALHVLLSQIDNNQSHLSPSSSAAFLIAVTPSNSDDLIEIAQRYGAQLIEFEPGHQLLKLDASMESSMEGRTLQHITGMIRESNSRPVRIGISLDSPAQREKPLWIPEHENHTIFQISPFAADLAGIEPLKDGNDFAFARSTEWETEIGRNHEKEALQSFIKAGSPVLLIGDQGIGKSRLINATFEDSYCLNVEHCRNQSAIESALNLSVDAVQSLKLLVLDNLNTTNFDEALLKQALTRFPNANIMITTSTPTLETHINWLKPLHLGPLPNKAIRSIIASRQNDDLNHQTADEIATICNGNPGLAIQLGTHSTTTNIEIPSNVTRVLLDQIGYGSRLFERLQTLSVYGSEFPRILITEQDPTQLQPYIDMSSNNGIETLRFRSELQQQVLNRSVEASKRKAIHLELASTISANQNAVAGLPHFIANHYEAIGEVEKAFEKWYEAAQIARAASNPGLSARYFYRALTLAELQTLSSVREDRRYEKTLSGYIDSVGIIYGYSSEELDETLKILQSNEFKQIDGYLEVTYRLARNAQGKGRLEQSLQISQRLLQDEKLTTDRRIKRMVSLTHGFSETYLGFYDAARTTLMDATEALEEPFDIEEQETFFTANILACWIDFLCGEIDFSVNAIAQMHELDGKSHEYVARLMKLSTSTSMYRMLGDISKAQDNVEKLIESTSSGKAPFWQSLAIMQQGALSARLKNDQQSLRQIENGLQKFKAINALHGVTEWQVLAAEYMLRANELETAKQYLDEADEHITQTSETMFESQVLMLRGLLAFKQNQPDASRALFEQATKCAQQQEVGLFELNARYLRANLFKEPDPTPKAFKDLVSEEYLSAVQRYWMI